MPSEKHVAVCNFPLSSHPRTMAKLVRRLAETAPNVRFSFLSTAKSNDSVFPPLSRAVSLPSNLRVYDVGDGLPAGYREATESDPRVEAELFLRAAPVNFLAGVDIAVRDAGSKVSLLLSDGLVSLVAYELSQKLHVPWVAFWTGAPYALSVHVHADLIIQLRQNAADEEKTLDMIPGLSVVRMVDLPEELAKAQDMSMISRMFRELGNVIRRATAVVTNSFGEMYPEPLMADLKSKFSILLFLGLRPSPPASDKTGCLTWLDLQRPQTVVYISFGSGALTNPSPNEITALAEALESTRTPFLWSLNDQLKARCLPGGFEERTSAQGKIVPWAPQREVLSHPACGAFVMQCGHNSVFESVAGGVPMICRPMAADQMLTARVVEEVWGIGIGVEGRVITKSGMVKALEMVLRSEEGKEIRKKVGEFRQRLLVAAGPEGRAEADFKTLVELISTL